MTIKNALLILLSFLAPATMYAQPATDTSLPYLKHKNLPAFRIQLTDTNKVFNTYSIKTGKPTILMLFSPDCEHCQHFADSMSKHMDELKDVQLFMFSFMDIKDIKKFAEKYKLNTYKNITWGKDIDFFFAGFYKLSAVPGIAVYDKKKQFVKLYNGGAKIADVLAAIKQ